MQPPSVMPQVYYMWRGGYNVVKIGTSKDISRRSEQLAKTFPGLGAGDIFMVSEPGSYQLERERHDQFGASRLAGEFFLMTPDLQAHIDQLLTRQRESKWVEILDGEG